MSERPMQEPTFLILTALAAGPQHGYGVITDVREISAGRVVLRAGTLYAALDRLQAEGLITGDREEVVDGRVRRYYRLTDSGGARLAAEAERLRRHAEAASTRLRARLAGGALFRGSLTGGVASPPGSFGGHRLAGGAA
ncbi:PadR family transcriptional regulator [Planomonospora algeriensis]